MKVLQYGKMRRLKSSLQKEGLSLPTSGQQKPETQAVGGVGSSAEGRLYLGLLRAGYQQEQVEIQTSILGGRGTLGGQVVDFVVYMPTPIPIELDGRWWHKNSGEEFVARAGIVNEYGVEPVVIYDDEVETVEQAVATVIRKLGRG